MEEKYYSKYVNEASLLGEFVRLVLSKQLSDEDKERIIDIGIKAMEGDNR